MPVQRLRRAAARTLFAILLVGAGNGAWAATSPFASLADPGNDPGKGTAPVHASAIKEIWNRKKGQVELFGNAAVRQPNETITADYILLDQNARTLTARGNCVYISKGNIVYGEEMHFNLDTRTGTIVGGRVLNDQFSLAGERINKLGDGHFQTHWGEYTTCHDCLQSWTLQARDVDMQIEGYAYLTDVMIRIKDAPGAWLPYLVVPMKTRRQSGLLFPGISYVEYNGLMFVQPWFWAISRSADMTFGFGSYTRRGLRMEWEGRYSLSERSNAKANLYLLRDSTFDPVNPVNDPGVATTRWLFNVEQTHEFPFGIDQKLKLSEIRDNRYPYEVGDTTLNAQGETVLGSTLSFSHSSPQVSSYVAANRYRNLLYIDPDATTESGQKDVNRTDARSFDENTVQVIPTAMISTNDRFLFGSPVAAGLSVGLTHFTRGGPFYDRDVLDPTPKEASGAQRICLDGKVAEEGFCPGFDPIRKATRFSVTPTLYSTINPVSGISLIPSLRYNYYFYNFPDQTQVSNLYRGYLLFQTDFVAQLERIYDTGNPGVPRKKHMIRPTLTYSWIPDQFVREEKEHPFLRQIAYAGSKNRYGYNFDNYDIVPIDESPNRTKYFTPLGQSITAGFTTQLIQRNGPDKATVPVTYSAPLELSMGQTINLRSQDQRPLGRVNTQLNYALDSGLGGSLTHYYYPYQNGWKHQVSTSMYYIVERGVRQGILTYDRSFSLGLVADPITNASLAGCRSLLQNDAACVSTLSANVLVNYSLNDYILPSLAANYNFVTHNFLSASAGVQFQSPSRCWKVSFTVPYDIERGWGFKFDASINLTGAGFGGITDFAAATIAPK